jgi:uncharacterized protein (DUF983 family)
VTNIHGVETNPRPRRPRRLRNAIWRALTLRCPRCGSGPLYKGFLTMHERCPSCGLGFEREHGFFVGAIYINYAGTVAVALAAFYALELGTSVPFAWRLAVAVVCAALFPLFFYRYSKSFWLGLDWFVNPDEGPPLRRAR